MTEPRLHPNGFIQYDLPTGDRLHIWHPDLPIAQVVHNPIHDHTFDFTSSIVLGRLMHVVYKFQPCNGGQYQLHRAVVSEDEDTKLIPLEQVGDMKVEELFIFGRGSRYSFKHRLFHKSEGMGLTATIVTKTIIDCLPFPRIAVPVDVDPDNNFRRHQYDTKKLMVHVDEVLQIVGPSC